MVKTDAQEDVSKVEDAQTRQHPTLASDIKPHNSIRNILITIALSQASFQYGYSTNVVTGALALPSFNAKFLFVDTASRIGGILGIFLGGGIVGAIIQGYLIDRFGRRAGMMLAACCLTFGSALGAGSLNLAMFLVARFFAGVGASISLTITPLFISELAPAHSRGFMVGIHAAAISIGYLVSALFSLGFSYMTSDIQWRLNFIINAVLAIVMLVTIFFLPESPRWLIAKGRLDDAARVLGSLHMTKHDPSNAIARAELIQIELQHKKDEHLPRGFVHIFKTKTLRKRAYATILVWLCSMSTGVLVIANLTPILFAGLGFGSTIQFALSAAWLVVCIVSVYVGSLFVDRAGRVNFLVIGGAFCTACLIIEAAMQAEYIETTNEAGLSAGVFAFFLFGVAYNGFYDAGSFVYTAEIWPSHLRSEGVTIAMVTFFSCGLAYNIPASTAFAQIGWRYYLVFIIITTAATITMWFYLPETASMTLEEIGEKFGETPASHFRDIDLTKADPSGNVGTDKV